MPKMSKMRGHGRKHVRTTARDQRSAAQLRNIAYARSERYSVKRELRANAGAGVFNSDQDGEV